MIRPAEVREEVKLAPLTAYRIGGPAHYYAKPSTRESLETLLRWAREEEISAFILGAGTNLLVSDRGYDGLVIHLKGFLQNINRPRTDGSWEVSAGISLTPWVRKTAQKGFAGLEALIGIPGTIGGALKMNAGAFSQEISDALIHVEIINENLDQEILLPENIGFSYRQAQGLKDCVILAARFKFTPDDPVKLLKCAREVLELRRKRQPLNWPSCGSVFKRPADDFAGRLIEAAGLKGFSIGGAKIPEKHANFIVNTGRASSEDVLQIIKHIKANVLEKFGVSLEREVILLGFSEEELAGT